MAGIRWLLRIEQENALFFGLKWSFVGCALALLMLSGCSLFDSGAVRYNSVSGEKRVPVLNPGGTGYAATDMAKHQGMVSGMQQMPLAQAMPEEVAGADMVQHYRPPPLPQQTPGAYSSASTMSSQPQPYAPPAQQPSGAYPTLPPTADATPQQLSAGDAAIRADINALESDLTRSQAQQQQMANQSSDDSWLPNLGVGEWFGGSGAQPAPAPVAGGMYPPAQLPLPTGAPTTATQAMDIPLAPGVQPQPLTNVPSSLIPPDMQTQGYLGDSRYATRRGQH